MVLSFILSVPLTVLSAAKAMSLPKTVVPLPVISLDRLSPRLNVPAFVTEPVISAKFEDKVPFSVIDTFCPIVALFITSPVIEVEPVPETF